jgi:regulator of protease activity HflC (stomatin/prohibitin superfamily)
MPGIIVIIAIILLSSIRQVNEYQRGVYFVLGKFASVKQPGWRLIIPIFTAMTKVDTRTKAIDIPSQEAITKDNITLSINAVLYYKVSNSEKAILEVEDYYYAVSQLAQTTMRNIVGESTLDELLQNREAISKKIKEIVDVSSDEWGLDVESVDLKDVVLPESMKRTMAKEAEAEREKRAVIIKALGDKEAATNLAAAAEMLSKQPGALHLRTLQSINDLSSDQSNTTVWMLPTEVLKGMEGFGKTGVPKK